MSRYLGKLTPVPEALEILKSHTRPVTESFIVPVWESPDHVLAKDVHAPFDWPPRHKSAYDGYAVRSSDTPGKLKLVGEAVIGTSDVGIKIGEGEAVYVTTGAYLPDGADAVVPEEKVEVEDGYIIVKDKIEPHQYIDPRGSITRKGQLLAKRGQLLTVYDVVGFLEVAVTEVEVYRKVRVAIISTGNELIVPSDPISTQMKVYKGKVVATTGGLLEAFIYEYLPWVEIVDSVLLPDNKEAVAWYIKHLLDNVDVVLLTGGTGPSNIDLFYQLKDDIGGELLFRGLFVKGGRPTSAFIVGNKPIIGLSGYPLSALHGFIRLVYPYLRYLGNVEKGAPPLYIVDAVLTDSIKAGRPRPIKVRVEYRDGVYYATPLNKVYQLSSANVGLVLANGIAFTGAENLKPGDKIPVLLYRDPIGRKYPV
ncbi:MAG: molybdopterin molybdotransferase MoeA [Desulfurococcales archaeon]|nr:molybdopterin molybdotransferase MoeA [Desulfurococcales archaeon]